MRSRRQILLVLLWDRNLKTVWSWEKQGGDSRPTSRGLRVAQKHSTGLRCPKFSVSSPQSWGNAKERDFGRKSDLLTVSQEATFPALLRRAEEGGAHRAGTKVCFGFAPCWRTFCPSVGLPPLFPSLWLFGTASPCHRCGPSMTSSVVHLFIAIWRLTQHVSKVWSECEWPFFIFLLLEE